MIDSENVAIWNKSGPGNSHQLRTLLMSVGYLQSNMETLHNNTVILCECIIILTTTSIHGMSNNNSLMHVVSCLITISQ